MYAIEVNGLVKRYKDTLAVENMQLNIREGELFALLGINGAGKSTLVNMLCCLVKPTKGSASVGGFDIITQQNEVKRIIGICPQETAVAKNLTVKENLMFMCAVHGIDKKTAQSKTVSLINKLSLEEVAAKKAGKLSGGFMRRLAIAMALVTDPKILFLDEPTLGLDVVSRSELWEVINGLKGSATVVLTTHYMQEAELLADRVGIMSKGRLIACGTPEELKRLTGEADFERAFVSLVKEGIK